MSTSPHTVSTVGLPARHQADRWREVISSSFVRLELTTNQQREGFAGKLRTRPNLTRVQVAAQPHSVRRTAEAIAGEPDGGYLLSLQTSNSCVVRQDGRSATLRAGDFALYDSRREYELAFPEGSHGQIVVAMPRSLEERVPALTRLTATRIDGSLLPAQRVAQDVVQLDRLRHGDDYSPWLHPRTLDMLVLCCGVDDLAEHPLLVRARGFIELHCTDPDLSPSHVAAALHVSLGYLHRLFSRTNTTVQQAITSARIERAAIDLLDPRCAHLTIRDISDRYSFSEPAHFTRSFRQYKAVSPSQWRMKEAS